MPTGTELGEEEAMQIRVAKRTAAEERQRCGDLALCFYFREPGYTVRTCPTKGPQREERSSSQGVREHCPERRLQAWGNDNM